MQVFNFICTLKGQEFKYKIEAYSEFDAKVKLREYIKNSVELELVTPKQPTPNSDFLNFFNDILNGKG